jgi:peptidoglycan/LPS O-acetylase OafA/YrhL
MRHRNNFDAIRLASAIAVLFTHAFVIATGDQQTEPFVILTLNQCPIGLVGVFAFFAISGYLVTGSAVSTASAWRFAVKRGARILPGLWVSLLVAALLVGPAISSLRWDAYFRDPRLAVFLGHGMLMDLGDFPLPGVLFSSNAAGDIVNGSLWTLRYEMMMYAMVLILGVLHLLNLPVAVGLLVLGIVAIHFEQRLAPFGDLGEWVWLVGFFASGMCAWFLREHRIWRADLASAAVLGLIGSTLCHAFIPCFAVFGSYLVFFAAFRTLPMLEAARRYGDLSYGLFIYGWPVAATLTYAAHGAISPWVLFVLSLAATLPIACLSWHLVEQPVLRLAHRSTAARAGMLRPAPATE